ncbi:hypothetical protein [Neorhizobium galegae]|uniref:hypothetical protein n=1 Tax=Neorhizobium galegae TaxID=399 RepID=UPI00126EAD8F|nr:hypothetical protein [Neorhizobium galegae]KAA9387726.1 hypothetical protein F4V88_15275 [Neorhizobium galegae]MCM2501956.1 hypothetical protein [Neorhizobium galegae]MCQ1772911.1 hypothetical protein [Neorhizobium galegae]MCQ1799415.1 hypothetical protein [Neorhizobium galegae]
MTYFDDTEYASRNLIELITHEEKELALLKDSLITEEAKFRVNRWDFETSDLNDDFSDAYVQAAFGRMARAHEEAGKLKAQANALQVSIGARQMAVQAMCGALLQIAKQGISVVHGGLGAAPSGRGISGIALKDIVWQARNQALHYEEGNFRRAVTDLFQQLENSHGSEFSLTQHAHQSRAKQTVALLGWNDYAVFQKDMKSLGL